MLTDFKCPDCGSHRGFVRMVKPDIQVEVKPGHKEGVNAIEGCLDCGEFFAHFLVMKSSSGEDVFFTTSYKTQEIENDR